MEIQFNAGDRKPPDKPVGIGPVILLCLFALPFAAFGTFAFLAGIKKWITGDTMAGAMLALFGLIFGLVGYGLMFLAVRGRKKSKEAAAMAARHPDEPWKLRPDWAAGRIKSSSTAPIGFFLLWSFLALGMSVPAMLSMKQEWHKGNYPILVVLVFPVTATCLLTFSFIRWRSRRRFGDCFFEPAQVPVPLGGTLDGLIQTGAPLRLEHELHLKLSCIRRVESGSGDHRSVNENILWQSEKVYQAAANLPDVGPSSSGIPVHFKLPADQPEAAMHGNEGVFWRLEARAKMTGPDFRVAFDLPVFKTADAMIAATDDSDPTAGLQAPIEDIRREIHSRIQVNDGPNGREFYFPAARNVGMALFTTLFTVVFNGVAFATYRFHAPILFPIVFGLVGLCFIFGMLHAWFKSSRVTIDPSGVTLVNRYLLFSRTRRFEAGDIIRFGTKVGMTSGTTAYSDLKLVTRSRQSDFEANKARYQQTGQMPRVNFRITDPSGITLASSIRDTSEAEWLVREMTKALGRRS